MIRDRTEQLERLYDRISAKPRPPVVAAEPNGRGHNREAVLSDEEIIERLRGARNAPKFEALFDRGDLGEYGGDHSSADAGLAGIVGFYTQDPEQLDRIFRRSALCREKWTGRPDYRRRTIEKALGGLSEVYSSPAAAPRRNGSTTNGTSAAAGLLVGRLLSEVEAERVEWLWQGRIPLGKITLVEGDPDNGKSALTTDLAARVSVGRPWPDGTPCERGGAVLLNAEDGLADTIKPRLAAAGGDASRVLALATVGTGEAERMISLPEDLGILRRGMERVGARLVIVDPFMAFLSGDVNAHRDQDVRRALAPLKTLAEDTGAAVVIVRHLNKGSGASPIYRGGGSIGIVGAARSALLVARHPEDEGRRVLARVKNNLAEPVPSLAFALAGTADGSVRVEWKGTTHHAADALLAAPADPEERSALEEAMDFLRDTLGDAPVWSVEIKKDARKAEITEATLRRAKTALGVRSVKEADGSWSWALPGNEEGQDAHKAREDVQIPSNEHLEHLERLPIDKPNQPAHRNEHLGIEDAQVVGDEHLEESGLPKRDSAPTNGQDAQGVQTSGSCGHGYPGGEGCYLCDPNHPYRARSEAGGAL